MFTPIIQTDVGKGSIIDGQIALNAEHKARKTSTIPLQLNRLDLMHKKHQCGKGKQLGAVHVPL